MLKPEKLVKKARELDIVFAITDHNTIGCHDRLRSLSYPFIPGEEIRTDKGDVVGLYLTEEIPKNSPFEETMDMIHEQGGLVYLPHMYDIRRKGIIPEGKQTGKVDIVEVFNARCLRQEFNDNAKSFAEKNKILQAVGSDAHFLLEFGNNYAEMPDFDIKNPKELMKALKEAKLVTKRAPICVRGPTEIISIWKNLMKK